MIQCNIGWWGPDEVAKFIDREKQENHSGVGVHDNRGANKVAKCFYMLKLKEKKNI